MSEVLVSALLAKIAELEKLAERDRDGFGKDGSLHTVHCGYRQQEWTEPCECDVPESVLRLCRAHRDIVELYQKQQRIADKLAADPATADADRRWIAAGIVGGLTSAVDALARGLGVETGPDRNTQAPDGDTPTDPCSPPQ